MINLSPRDVRLLRLRAQRLQPYAARTDLTDAVNSEIASSTQNYQASRLAFRAHAAHDGLIDVVKSVVAVNAQSIPTMRLALRARVSGLTVADIDSALFDARALVRGWLMRGTLHLAASDEYRWLVGVFGPAFLPGGAGRRAALGLDPDTLGVGLKHLHAILDDHGALTRTQIVEELNTRGLALNRKSQTPIHLIRQAALAGLLCCGPDRDSEETFVLVDGWLAPQPSVPVETPLAELARRYVAGYGPATLRDFVAWSGLRASPSKVAWQSLIDAGQIIETRVGDLSLWVTPAALEDLSEPALPAVSLLAAFDTLILGYADRDLVVDPAHRAAVYHGGQTVPVVLVDGAAAGVWRSTTQFGRLDITVDMFHPVGSDITDLIGEQAGDIGRLLGRFAALEFV